MPLNPDQTLIIPTAGANALWELTRSEVRERALFHGTSETLVGPLHGSAYDGICWSVQGSPAIAQTYMGNTELTMDVLLDENLDASVVPNSLLIEALLMQMGWPVIVERDPTGAARGWATRRGRFATYRELRAYLEKTLGYHPDTRGMWRFKLTPDSDLPGGLRVMPAAYQRMGQLIVLLPQAELRIYDHAGSREADLQELDYHRHDLFAAAREAGYDGIRITDFGQSPLMGNVEHQSIGLFPAGLAKVTECRMPARYYDVGSNLWCAETDDFVAGHRAAVRAALAAGRPVRAKVLAEYPDLTPPAVAPEPTLAAPPALRRRAAGSKARRG